jgi:hypothetical protein
MELLETLKLLFAIRGGLRKLCEGNETQEEDYKE